MTDEKKDSSLPAAPVSDPSIQYYETDRGGRIYQIPLEAFPGLWGYVYLVFVGDYRVMIDTGSGYGNANQQLEDGLSAVSELIGEVISLSGITHILITHGHIDHFGGLAYICPRTSAKLGIHELDRRVVANHVERLSIVARRLGEFLIEAGVSPQRTDDLIGMYKITKSLFRSVKVDFTYEASGMRLGPFEFLHVPGHCAGHVVIRLHDVLFSGDHVLDETSPHQAPERLTLFTGLDHYIRSLETLRPWAREAHLTLGGHERPIVDLETRLDSIRSHHMQRLQQVLDLLVEPRTISEVSQELFGQVHGYNVLLALEEAGAHVEFLYQRGLLEIDNLSELETSNHLVPIRYRCVECEIADLPRF